MLRNRPLASVYFSVFLMRFSFGLIVFSLPIYVIKVTNVEIAIVAAAYPIAEVATVLIFGALADKIGRKTFIYSGLLISGLVLFSFSLTTRIPLLAMLHAIQGLAAAMIIASSLALVADLAGERVRGREMGFYDFANTGGYACGYFISGALISYFTIPATFHLASFIAFIAAAFTYVTVKEPARPGLQVRPSPLDTLKILIANPTALAMFPMWLTITTILGIGLTFGSKLAVESGYTPMAAGTIFAGIALVLAVTQPTFGYLSDKVGRRKMMLLGVSSLIGLLLSFVASSTWRLRWEVTVPLQILLGLGGFAFAPAALATLADVAPKHGRGTTMGAYSLVISLGTIIGPLLGGWILDRHGLMALFYACILILVGALGLTALIGVSGRRR